MKQHETKHVPEDMRREIAGPCNMFQMNLNQPVAELLLDLVEAHERCGFPVNYFAGIVANGLVVKAAAVFFHAMSACPPYAGVLSDDEQMTVSTMAREMEHAAHIICSAVEKQLNERFEEKMRERGKAN